ncbi:alpha-1,4-glucan--maltose-1-phosphate maltosyltransferase [Corynebacterium kozikiae]|uniref:alpha-1,4-glucan--maltose-1-phosphate maltosyltransferase n=1 Tax=Corynebacterium kozikiae TaxID=2968469 RepID=UPI00211C9E2B|nr:alpha-1,4-glucan--maltose-1-phosphate maltosyltransferase [Corynebacterium sp. 76QC2CO]MCQ9343583.1 alpha-1,4-glucan--maltose-1-phosphate maltosyltransferase [Corynebacterium sp. 76QC2CO]
MIGRLAVEDVRPLVHGGARPSKGVVGEYIPVSALVWREGYDAIAASLLVTSPNGRSARVTMERDQFDQDRVHGAFVPDSPGIWTFQVEAWSDPIATWRNAVIKKTDAGQDEQELANDLTHGATLFRAAAAQIEDKAQRKSLDAAADALSSPQSLRHRLALALSTEVSEILAATPLRELVTPGHVHEVEVTRTEALFNSWYELFPRSTGGVDEQGKPVHGTFATTAAALDRVAAMGFDTVYFPPIHPIGEINRKGRNNTLTPGPGDVGSPWAIGSKAGGHDATEPKLGTVKDFQALLARAKELGLEIALDLALQAAPDHPWAKAHPEFFTVLADGTIAYAENPPKKYQDIYPLNFDNAPKKIYKEILRVVRFWVDMGVTTFRVDNPHTKPTNFWAWLIAKVHEDNPEVIFLAEAFTRPARLYGLAKAGFDQSYTYFTWKTSKEELEDFGMEIAEMADVSRPNLFVNTPDILHESLQYGGRAMFAIRATLAATLSPLWGVYSGFELYEHIAVATGSEEYLDSEKYELRPRDFEQALEHGDSLEPYITALNRMRREHPALQQLRTIIFHPTTNDQLLAYSKVDPISGDHILVVINLDPNNTQEGTVELNFQEFGYEPHATVTAHDLVTNSSFNWTERTFVRLTPLGDVAHVLHLPQVDRRAAAVLAQRTEVDYNN